jgi:hypothetical protein
MARRKQNGADSAAHMNNLKKDLDALQRDMRLLVERVASTTSERVVNTANGAAEDVEEWTSDGVESVRDLIRTQPLAAIALSMSAGAALSFLLRRA